MNQYDVAQHPKTKKWYLVGHCEGNTWMPVSSPYNNKADAIKRLAHQIQADKATRLELYGI